MSHTDKDTPDWVTATWWKPWHHPRCPHGISTHTTRPCSLPTGPRRVRTPLFGRNSVGCEWVPVSDRNWHSAPPRWFRSHGYTRPDRQAARVACWAAAAEHRAGREVLTIPPASQHRHRAAWDWM